ncbi:hypothetical protein SDJN03_24722, partial [Cucurbita argyrosperma subsp. sororia]
MLYIMSPSYIAPMAWRWSEVVRVSCGWGYKWLSIASQADDGRGHFPSFLVFLVNDMIGLNSFLGNKCAFLDSASIVASASIQQTGRRSHLTWEMLHQVCPFGHIFSSYNHPHGVLRIPSRSSLSLKLESLAKQKLLLPFEMLNSTLLSTAW